MQGGVSNWIYDVFDVFTIEKGELWYFHSLFLFYSSYKLYEISFVFYDCA